MANRVYSYGLVPIGWPPREAIDGLWCANYPVEQVSGVA